MGRGLSEGDLYRAECDVSLEGTVHTPVYHDGMLYNPDPQFLCSGRKPMIRTMSTQFQTKPGTACRMSMAVQVTITPQVVSRIFLIDNFRVVYAPAGATSGPCIAAVLSVGAVHCGL